MSHYKPYPAYKDSGVEWLGKVPEHWGIQKLKWLANLKSGDFITSESIKDSGDFPVYGGNGLRGFTDSFTHDGDYVLIGRQGALCGNINYASGAFWASEHAVVVAPYRKTATKWLGELLRSMNLNQYSVSAAQPGLAVERIVDLMVPVAPLDEQREISALLDRETARIDALISKKTRFIELLREKRQALITHAVTKGLDPSVKMKDSGVEWLGEVPEHWDALPLRRVVTAVKTGGTPSSESPSPDAEALAWYTPGDFGNSLVLGASEKRVSSQVVISGEAKVYPAGSVMVVSIGATLGKVGFLAEAASANQQINAVIPNGCVDGYFLAYSLSVKTEAMWFLANAATIGIMNQEKTKEIWVAIPSIAEQMGISAHLDRETSRIDRLVGKTERSIELLKERRSALITAAVTGQIDLRETA